MGTQTRNTTTAASMTFWQENYTFIKEVYDTRYQKMVEWMDNVEMAIQKVCASKVYTSAEFKREKDNFQSLCKNLERAETKKWLNETLETLMKERADGGAHREAGQGAQFLGEQEEDGHGLHRQR